MNYNFFGIVQTSLKIGFVKKKTAPRPNVANYLLSKDFYGVQSLSSVLLPLTFSLNLGVYLRFLLTYK